MIVTLFFSELRADMDDETKARYEADHQRLLAVVGKQPGFVSIRGYTGEGGERLSVVMFEDAESHRRWRDHPDHQRTQQAGRDHYYQSYRVVTCSSLRDHEWPSGSA